MTPTTTRDRTSGAAQAAWERYAVELQTRHNLSTDDLETVEIDYKRGFADALTQTGTA